MIGASSSFPAGTIPTTSESPRPGPSRPSIERQLIRAILFSAAFCLVARTKVDPDLWGHVRFGGDILASGFADADPYSFTSDIPWINHEWLSEVIFYLAWTLGGGLGLILLKIAVVAGVVALAAQVVGRRGLPPLMAEIMIGLVLLGTWPRTSLVRPQLFSVLLFAALLWVFHKVSEGKARSLRLVPLIFLCWINLHGGWVVGFGVFGLWVLAGLFSNPPGVPRTSLVATAFVSAAALLVNPYGWHMLAFIATTVRFDRADIVDWQPIWHSSFLLGLWIASLTFAAYATFRHRRLIPIRDYVIVVILAIASLRVGRIDAFFTLAVVMLLGANLGRRQAPAESNSLRVGLVPSLGGLVTGVGIVAGFATTMPLSCIGLDMPWTPEREAGAFIQANHLKGRLLSSYGWGQYVIWHFGRTLLVSLDGRRETVYSPSFLRAHYALYDHPERSTDLLDRLDPDYAWLPVGTPLIDALETRGWSTLFSGPRSVLLSRDAIATVTPGPLTVAACFPGP